MEMHKVPPTLLGLDMLCGLCRLWLTPNCELQELRYGLKIENFLHVREVTKRPVVLARRCCRLPKLEQPRNKVLSQLQFELLN